MTALLPISIDVGPGRRVDVGVPPRLRVVDLLPQLARLSGGSEPDPGVRRLVTPTGEALSADLGLAEQGVGPGAVLSVVRDADEPTASDDPAEAMADAVAASCLGWDPRLARPAAIGCAVALLGLGATGLLLGGRLTGSPVVGAWAGAVVAAVLLVGAHRADRRGDALAALLAAWASFGYAAVAGEILGGLPAAGLLVCVAGGLAARMLTRGALLVLPAAAVGAIVGLLALVEERTVLDAGFVAIVALAAVALGAGALPQVALLVAGGSGDAGRDVLRAFLATAGLVVVVLVPEAVGTGVAGVLLAVVTSLLGALRARRHHSAAEVLLGSGFALAGAVAVLVCVMVQWPAWAAAAGMAGTAVGLGAGLAVTLESRSRESALRVGLLLDQLEGALLVAVLPLVVVGSGVVDTVRSLSLG